MLNVVCINFRDLYADAYVDRLYSMTKRHLSLPFRFTCVTDRVRPLHPDIEQLQRNDIVEGRGSRNKLQLFDPTWLPFETMLYMDVTLIIKGSLDGLVECALGKDFVTIPDWTYESFNSCVMWLGRTKRVQTVWDTFAGGKRFIQKTEGGDQDYIYNVFRENNWLDEVDYFPPEAIVSFKNILRMRSRNRQMVNDMVEKASIIKFHGRPKPHEWSSPGSRLKYLIRHRPLLIRHWRFLAGEMRQHWR
jgi:hypothetical protein